MSCHLNAEEGLHRYGEAARALSAKLEGVWCAQRTEIRLESLWQSGRERQDRRERGQGAGHRPEL